MTSVQRVLSVKAEDVVRLIVRHDLALSTNRGRYYYHVLVLIRIR